MSEPLNGRIFIADEKSPPESEERSRLVEVQQQLISILKSLGVDRSRWGYNLSSLIGIGQGYHTSYQLEQCNQSRDLYYTFVIGAATYRNFTDSLGAYNFSNSIEGRLMMFFAREFPVQTISGGDKRFTIKIDGGNFGALKVALQMMLG